MNILQLPLTPTYFITVFNAYSKYSRFSISRDGTVIEGGDSIETNFANKRLRFHQHKVFGKISDMTEDDAKAIFIAAGQEEPYINYTDRLSATNSARDSFMSFLKSEGWEMEAEMTWLIIPKKSKELKGKKIPMEFNVGALDFSNRANQMMELDVFMSPITKTSKSVTFSVRIPEFIFNQCMTDPDIKNRPEKNYIESDTISTLHTEIWRYVSQANSIWKMDESAKKAKKIICINFSSSENTTRDDWNHGYTGQKISTTFNFYVAYETLNTSQYGMFTFKKYQTGMGSTEKGISGIIDSELQGAKNWIRTTKPTVKIGWTQEREDFLTHLEEQFRTLSSNLNNFLKDLNEDKIELLIQNSSTIKLIG